MKIGRLASGGLITNYFCTSACRHCLYNCGPHWEKRYIGVEVAEKNFRAVKALGCSAVHIGGGEPLLRPEELGAVLDIAGGEFSNPKTAHGCFLPRCSPAERCPWGVGDERRPPRLPDANEGAEDRIYAFQL